MILCLECMCFFYTVSNYGSIGSHGGSRHPDATILHQQSHGPKLSTVRASSSSPPRGSPSPPTATPSQQCSAEWWWPRRPAAARRPEWASAGSNPLSHSCACTWPHVVQQCWAPLPGGLAAAHVSTPSATSDQRPVCNTQPHGHGRDAHHSTTPKRRQPSWRCSTTTTGPSTTKSTSTPGQPFSGCSCSNCHCSTVGWTECLVYSYELHSTHISGSLTSSCGTGRSWAPTPSPTFSTSTATPFVPWWVSLEIAR